MRTYSLLFTNLFLFLFVVGCTKPQSQAPENVNAGEVKTILMVQDPAQIDACEHAVLASGAEVLYKNTLGVIMTNAAASDLNLAHCDATVNPNRRVPLAGLTDEEEKVDLPTLLRLIPAEEIGARSFVKANPSFDGRGVVVAVLDTGVELDHPVLAKTTTGEQKIIDFQDFSGEGYLSLDSVEVDANFIFKAPSGLEYFVKEVGGKNYRFGLFKASTLDIDSDTFEDIGVITYEKDGKFFGRIDTNANFTFGEETELTNFAASGDYTKLGKKASLSTALNILEDGKAVTLCFDDGSHGTHVAGIAAGYNEAGLQGVAPGAKVMAVKIGDNRLSGGSTTTASKMLAIDYAVKNGAHVINISYGIRAGSDLGLSAIDRYVDKVALETGVLFSISAGNEGPGIQTIGTPAGANLAITPGAYISKKTAHDNYGYIGVEQNNMWYFSSVGPRSDGGWKPSIAAPGSAVSSLPQWNGGHENYRGTSMAAPQVAGGLALVLSAAQQSELPTDRISVTQAVYNSAKKIENLKWIQQGHGLMSVPGAVEKLKALKGKLPVEYSLSVNSITSPSGKGKGILVRSRNNPANVFTVSVSPQFPAGTPEEVKTLFLRTYKLEATADWVKIPESFWAHARRPRTFQVDLDLSKLEAPGLYSEKISAIDETTNEVAFDIPVTVVRPYLLNDENKHTLSIKDKIKVGDTNRYFLDIPAGTTAAQIELKTDGPRVWGQLLDSDGRHVTDIIDSERVAPQPPLFQQTEILRPGVYELDLSAPAYVQRSAEIEFSVKLFSLDISVSPPIAENQVEVLIQNNFDSIQLTPKAEVLSLKQVQNVKVEGNIKNIPLVWTEEDNKKYSQLKLTFDTAKRFYDMMTDYPYMLYCADGRLFDSGGLELHSTVELSGLCLGESRFELQGAFTHKAPDAWFTRLTKERILKNPISLMKGNRTLVETGQQVPITLDLSEVSETLLAGHSQCATLTLEDASGKVVQKSPVCGD